MDHCPGQFGTGCQQARRDGHADQRRGSTEGGQAADNHIGHPQASREEQIPPPAILLTAGNTCGGKHDPYAREHRNGWAGAPHSETAGIVESDRWARQDPYGGILSKRAQT